MGKKTEKFLFDQHIFDEPEEDEEEFEEPPPPTFSEEELETVRQKADQEAYERGKADGVAESKASREQMVAQVLQQIGQDASILFTNEEHRDKTFERESVQLALSIFEKLFPEEKGKHGFESLKNTISEILQRQENQSEIRIEVHPDAVDGIKEHISSLNLMNQSQQRFEITGNNKLNDQACKIQWKDGGAVRDIDALAEEIRTILHETLAGNATKSHDSNNTPIEGDIDQTTTTHDLGTVSATITDNAETGSNSAEQSAEPVPGTTEEMMEKPDE